MQKIKLQIAYDGTDFHGFARQDGLRTVQGVLEDTLRRVSKHPVEVFGSGRTDAGVHARAQVVHFTQEFGPPAERYVYLMRRALPQDLVAVSAENVPEDFHARFSVRSKTYRYSIQRAKVPDIYTHRFTWHEPRPMDVSVMRREAQALIGTHDFTSLCSTATSKENKRRTIYDVEIRERDSYIDILCTGNGFLQYMVRIIAGTLVDLAEGRLKRSLGEILAARERRVAGRTAPARGLTLWDIHYD